MIYSRIHSRIHSSATIHPTALIEEGAYIGADSQVGAYSYVGSQVIIGEHCDIAHYSGLYGKTHIGNHNRIFSHTILGSIPQDLKYKGEDTALIIGDHNTIREFCLVNTGTADGGGKTVIGHHNLLMSHTHVGHDGDIANHTVLSPGAMIGGHVKIDDYAIVSGGTAVHQFVHIGKYAFLAGGGILVQDLPPFCLAQGNTAQIRSLNVTGLRRHLPHEIDGLKKAFKEIFMRGENMRKKAQTFYETTDNNHIKELCQFVIENKRGIPIATNTHKTAP